MENVWPAVLLSLDLETHAIHGNPHLTWSFKGVIGFCAHTSFGMSKCFSIYFYLLSMHSSSKKNMKISPFSITVHDHCEGNHDACACFVVVLWRSPSSVLSFVCRELKKGDWLPACRKQQRPSGYPLVWIAHQSSGICTVVNISIRLAFTWVCWQSPKWSPAVDQQLAQPKGHSW